MTLHSIPPSSSIPRILLKDELSRIEISEYLIHKTLPVIGLATLIGAPSSYKTFIAIEIAACIATGHDFYGRKCKQGKILYLTGEGKSGFGKRIKAWEQKRGCSIPNNDFATIVDPVMLNENLPGLREALLNHQDEYGKLSLIVIDTLNRTMAGDENSSKDMGQFVQACTQLINEFELCCLVLHHTGKSANNGARGHSSLLGATDIGMEVKRSKDLNVCLRFDAKPPKDDAPPPKINLVGSQVDLSDPGGTSASDTPKTSLVFDPIYSDLSAVAEPLQPAVEAAILDYLPLTPTKKSEVMKALSTSSLAFNDKMFDRALSKLCSDNRIESTSHGYYRKVQLST